MAGPDIRVCFLGDSFTLGQGDGSGLGWPGRAHAAERGRGLDLTSYNLGVRGQTGAEIAERGPAEVDARMRGRGDRCGLVLSFGANDLYFDRPRAETLGAAHGLLRWAAGQGYHALVVGMPPDLDPALDRARGALDAEMAQVASDHAAPFLHVRHAVDDWSAWHREAREGDGVHPNAEGYARVARVFGAWTGWRAWLDG